MKRLIVMGLLAGIGTLGSAAELHRVGGDTIALRGAIAEGDVDQLRQLATPATTVLRINSAGGDPQAAMLLGRYLRQRQWRLAIDTVCAGSCALYVFPAAQHTSIPDTAVLALQESAFLRAQEGPQHMRRSLIGAGVPADELERDTAALAVQLAQVAARWKRRLPRSWASPPPSTATSGRWRRRPMACASAFPTRRRPSIGGRGRHGCSAATASPACKRGRARRAWRPTAICTCRPCRPW